MEFNQLNSFYLGAIVSNAAQYNKKIELNIWVDTDLDVDCFVKSFNTKVYQSNVDFVYYRFDHHNFSFKLKSLMTAFDQVKHIQF